MLHVLLQLLCMLLGLAAGDACRRRALQRREPAHRQLGLGAGMMQP